VYWNLSFIYGVAGILWAVLFSFILNRFALVANSKPNDNAVPVSRIARYGKKLVGWYGFIAIAVILLTYLLGHYIIGPPRNVLRDKVACAIDRGNKEDILFCVEQGFDINEAMYWADSTETVLYLIEHGANINYVSKFENTVLHRSIRLGNHELTRMLIKHGADIHAKNRSGNNALQLTIHIRKDKYAAIVKALIEAGCDVNSLTYDNKLQVSALDIAEKYNLNGIASLLRSHGAKTGAELKKEAGE
jgi:hypothetical protein